MFDPENPTRAIWSWYDENGWLPDNRHEIGLEDIETVLASEYDQLLEQYKLLSGRPESKQLCTKHRWLDTLGQLPCWPPVKIYKCGLCLLTGNLRGRLLTPNGFPQYDLSDMTYEGRPENGQAK